MPINDDGEMVGEPDTKGFNVGPTSSGQPASSSTVVAARKKDAKKGKAAKERRTRYNTSWTGLSWKWVSGPLGHWVVGSLGQRVSGSMDHWVTGSLGHLVTTSLGHRVIGSPGRRISGSLGHWVTGSPCPRFWQGRNVGSIQSNSRLGRVGSLTGQNIDPASTLRQTI